MRKIVLFVLAMVAMGALAIPVKSNIATREINTLDDKEEIIPSPDGYVQKGLIAMWDGEWNVGRGIHDSNTNVWNDLIGDNNLIFNDNNKSNIRFEDFCLFSSQSGKYYVSSDKAFYSFVTIEVCFSEQRLIGDNSGTHAKVFDSGLQNRRLTGYRCLKWDGWNNAASLAGGYGGVRGHESWMPNTTSAIFASANASARVETAYLNGLLSKGYNDKHEFKGSGVMRIGGDSTLSYSPSCRVFNVRLYSRALSDAEIAHNYKIDKIRFNLP